MTDYVGLYIYIIFILSQSYIRHFCPLGVPQYCLRLYQWHDYELYDKSSGCNIKSVCVSDNLTVNREPGEGIKLIKKSVWNSCSESCSTASYGSECLYVSETDGDTRCDVQILFILLLILCRLSNLQVCFPCVSIVPRTLLARPLSRTSQEARVTDWQSCMCERRHGANWRQDRAQTHFPGKCFRKCVLSFFPFNENWKYTFVCVTARVMWFSWRCTSFW